MYRGHGDAAGNHVLKEIVNRITSALRPSDLVARMAVKKFPVMMPETDLDAGHQIAERLRSCIAGTPVENIAVTVSIDAAVVQPDMQEEELAAALWWGDEALYEAKRAGRNCVMAVGNGERRAESGERILTGSAAGTPRSIRSP